MNADHKMKQIENSVHKPNDEEISRYHQEVDKFQEEILEVQEKLLSN